MGIELAKSPLIKWPGGKRFIASKIASALESIEYERYFEPFAGGAALFFATRPKCAYLSDTNKELINLYKVVRDNPKALIKRLGQDHYKNSARNYYAVRATNPRGHLDRAARLYYLMRLSFNGIYRENLNGQFNVPYGHNKKMEPLDADAIISAGEALKSAELNDYDFRVACQAIRAGDVVYFDPPYTTAHNNNGFIKYNRQLFTFYDQVELAELAIALVAKKVNVVVSNADHPAVNRLYVGKLKRLRISRRSLIAASADFRREISESVFVSPWIADELREAICK